MANYNYGGATPLNTQPYADIYNNMDEFNKIAFDYGNAPELGYEQWLRSMMPSLSNTQERTLRSAYGSFLNDFLAKRQMGYFGNNTKPFRWAEYLKNFDVNKELMRMDPSARYENASRFTAPARVVAF